MRIRSFGLLQLGPLPLGAFAELPEGEELFDAPRKERLRMFAAGPATNIFAERFDFLLLFQRQLPRSLLYTECSRSGIVEGRSRTRAGMLPWDSILEIRGTPIPDYATFDSVLSQAHRVMMSKFWLNTAMESRRF